MPWSRSDKIAVWAAVVLGVIAAVGIALSFFVPEVRQRLHLEKPSAQADKPGQKSTQRASQEPASEQPETAVVNGKPTKASPTRITAETNSIAAPGAHIEQRSYGSNSPNVIGSGNQFNFGPSQRHLSNEEKIAIQRECAALPPFDPALFSVNSVNDEAATYRDDFLTALKGKADVRAGSMWMNPPRGLWVQINNENDPAKTFAEALVKCLRDSQRLQFNLHWMVQYRSATLSC